MQGIRAGMRAGFRTLQLGRRHMSLTVETINPAVVGAQYAVRGELVLRAAEIKKQIAATPDSLPIKKVLECNIGNPQAVEQQPLSFGRQVQSLLAWPALMDMPGASETFAPDAIARAQEYLEAETKVGAYTESQGLSIVRQQVAEFIAARDGVPAVKENIFLTDGASKGVELGLGLGLANPNPSPSPNPNPNPNPNPRPGARGQARRREIPACLRPRLDHRPAGWPQGRPSDGRTLRVRREHAQLPVESRAG